MEEERRTDYRPIAYMILAVVILNLVAWIITMLGVILTIGLTAGAGYLGYKAALDGELWENRRIQKDKMLETQRQRELAYFQAKGKDWMAQVVNNYYDDKQRDLYPPPSSHFDEVAKRVQKVKELFK